MSTDPTFVAGYIICGIFFVAFGSLVVVLTVRSLRENKKSGYAEDETLKRMVEEARRGGSQVEDFDRQNN
jgi:hypothetical protein